MRELSIQEMEETSGGLVVAAAIITIAATGLAIGLTLSSMNGGSCEAE